MKNMKTENVLKLILKMGMPMVISMMVNSLYNIVDSLFVAKMSENAMTALSLVFPIQNLISSIMIGFGIGINAVVSFYLGAGDRKRADKAASQGLFLGTVHGLVFTVIGITVMPWFLRMFTDDSEILSLGVQYTNVAFAFSVALSWELVFEKTFQAVGRMTASMVCMLAGCIVNIILDPILIFGLDMGMRGAALATITGQIISFAISLRYMFHFKTIHLTRESFVMRGEPCGNIFRFGASACFNQIAMAIVQVVMNNTLSRYGAQSVYGGDIPLACSGIISKVNMIFMAIVIGISQGTQPIIGFNYGAGKYRRVRKTYLLALAAASALSVVAFAAFQIFPRQIISAFGEGSELYFQFSERYFRIYMFLTIVNGIQPVTSNFFNSIGKARLGVFMSLTRQILFLLPLIIIFPIFMGIDGVMYAGPIADGITAIVCGVFTVRELKELTSIDRDAHEKAVKI